MLTQGRALMRFNRLFIAVLSLALAGCSDNNDHARQAAFSAPPSDCLWVGPYVLDNPGFNFAYPDTGAVYWSVAYRLPEGASHITLEGDYPRSRYMSYNSYNKDTTPAQSLTDRDIIASAGSINPFMIGSPRNNTSRRYSITVLPGTPAAGASAASDNTLYDATGTPGEEAVLVYRNYVPDNGSDQTGDAGLPRVTLHMADGSVIQGEQACTTLVARTAPAGIPRVPEEIYAAYRAAYDPSRDPPVFRATYGIPFLLQCDFRGDCRDNPPRTTAFYANADNQYVYSFLDHTHGEVIVLRGRIPLTPRTLQGDDVFAEGELRYWSICQNEFYSQRVKACLYDQQLAVNADGFYTIVTSKPADRPANAREDCGVHYLPWPDDGDGFGVIENRQSDPDSALLIVRNMLPATDFEQAIQNTSTAGDEAAVMGEYLPRGRYFSRREFEGLGCNPWLALPYAGM